MRYLLAQSEAGESVAHNVFEIVTAIFSKIDALAHPDVMLEHLQNLSVVWAVIFLVAGLTCMLNGYKFYRVVTIVLALGIGVFGGYWLGKQIGSEAVVAGCLGLLLAVVCFPLMKYAVAVLGGLVGAFAGANLWSGVAHVAAADGAAAQHYWIGALVGLIVCGMMAFILFRFSVILFTAITGSTLVVIGAMSLLMQIPNWRETVADSLSAHAIVIPLLVIVPALIGLILQEAQPEPAGKPA